MKTKYMLRFFTVTFFVIGSISTGFAQSGNCTIVEKQGSLLTIACPGQGTRVMDMGGTADTYKKGDTIAIPSANQPQKDRNTRSRVP